VRNFRLLWIGEGISLLGDQFYLIALPWLVLQLTGSALALGTVLALAGIPRALFMLVGGAFVDRFSPRAVMLASNLTRLVLVGLLTALVLTNTTRIELLYAFALAFGLADAFYYPGQSAIVPQLLPQGQLQAGNAFVQGTAQLSVFLGPLLAGGLIALLGQTASADRAPGTLGSGIAFGLDTLSFIASLVCLTLIQVPGLTRPTSARPDVIAAIREGFAHVWGRPLLRLFFFFIVVVNFLVLGPLFVGIPVLAATRLVAPRGAAAFGIIMSAFGGGALLGIVLSNVLPPLNPERLGTILLLSIAIQGVGVALIPLFASTTVIAVIALLIGAANGYFKLIFFTWLQKRTPRELMGRVMSLLMFAAIGLAPVSNALAGLILQINLNMLFIGGGLLMAALSLLSLALPAVRQMGAEPVAISRAA
jgi:MFS family permease